MKKSSISIISIFFLLMSIIFNANQMVKADTSGQVPPSDTTQSSTTNTSISFYITDPTGNEFPDKSWIQFQNLNDNTVFGEQYDRGKVFTNFKPGKYKMISINLRDSNNNPTTSYRLDRGFEIPVSSSEPLKIQATAIPSQDPGNQGQSGNTKPAIAFYITDTNGVPMPNGSWIQLQNIDKNSTFGEPYASNRVYNLEPGKYKLLNITVKDDKSGTSKVYSIDKTFDVPSNMDVTKLLRIEATATETQSTNPPTTDNGKVATVSVSNVNAVQNSTTNADITIENVENFSGANFDITYDPTIAVCTEINLGSFLKDFIITSNLNEAANGKVKIALASTSGVSGRGTILKLKFAVKGTSNSQTSIKINNLLLNNVEGKDIVAKSVDGILKVSDDIKYGDVNGDGKVTAADVTLILRHAAGLSTISDDKIKAADVNGDGKISSGDATLVLRYIAELIKDFPVQNAK